MTYYSQQVRRLRDQCFPDQTVVDKLIRVKQLIDRRYADDIPLNYLAREVFLSKFHLIRLFKRCYGITPYQYLTGVRIKAAKQCLKAGVSVTETCFALNFNSPASFSALFKRHTGVSPSGYPQKAIFNKSIPRLRVTFARSN